MSLSFEDVKAAAQRAYEASFKPYTYVLPRRTIAPAMRAAGVPEEEVERTMRMLGDTDEESTT